ncbi:hypothetical protein QEZ54_25395 [Catellatospora sp. KI3]|uniref:hypothetical protein n=1 Tax=Catellatospora sp. KI3 TaxID=3041620 RepID=UPI0024823195|nr:hypothetical protein [Catellatospora sp. KI3]MDI1464311.1 hypothetical protein [Catellatospora sp. KI3]
MKKRHRRRPGPVRGWSQVLDDATRKAARRRRRRVANWLVAHPKTLLALRVTRGAWRRRHVPIRAGRAVLGGVNWLTDQAMSRASRTWAHRSARARQSTYYGWDGLVTCALCGRRVPLHRQQTHVLWHEQQGRHAQYTPTLAVGSAATGRPTGSKTGPIPNPNRGGSRMATALASLLLRAAAGIGELPPGDAWFLTSQLVGLARGSVAVGDALGDYAETLDTARLDPRVTRPILAAMENYAQAGADLAKAAKTFRDLYESQMEAAEAGVSQPNVAGFFDPRNAS